MPDIFDGKQEEATRIYWDYKTAIDFCNLLKKTNQTR
jgi:hypothetical protein